DPSTSSSLCRARRLASVASRCSCQTFRSGCVLQVQPTPQHFGHAPCLGKASVAVMRGVAIENLADRSQACIAQVMRERLAEGPRGGGVPMALEGGEGEGAKQPAPPRALVVGAVAAALITAIAPDVRGIAAAEAPQAVAGEQLARTRFHHGAHLRW